MVTAHYRLQEKILFHDDVEPFGQTSCKQDHRNDYDRAMEALDRYYSNHAKIKATHMRDIKALPKVSPGDYKVLVSYKEGSRVCGLSARKAEMDFLIEIGFLHVCFLESNF